MFKRNYLALINQAGGLYGRILTEVVSTDGTQWGLYTRPRSRFSHTDRLSLVNKMFIIWQNQEQFNSFNLTGLYWTDILLANDDEPNLILPKFARPLYFFFSIRFLALTEINIVRWNSQWFCILVGNFFTSKHYRSRWENLDCGQYPIQPIKFVNLVVPSPCETEPYNNYYYY